MSELNPPEGPFLLAGPATDIEANKLRTSAGAFRRMLDALLGTRQGVQYTLGSCLDLKVTATGADVNVSVNAGAYFIRGTQAGTQGMYEGNNDATKVINVLGPNPAHATLARIDLVVARINDSAYTGAIDNQSIEMVTGTPAGSPAVPAAPANSLILAQILIPAASAVIASANITDRRVPPGVNPVKLFEIVGAFGTYDFQNIPPGFRSLRIIYKLRDASATNGIQLVNVQFNGDATNAYASEENRQNGVVTAVPSETNNVSSARTGIVAGGALANVNVYGVGQIEIPAYTDTNNEKLVDGTSSVSLGTGAAGALYTSKHAAQWRSTAAIVRATLLPNGGTGWNANSWAEMWGLV